jgi:hypothetical protein
MRSLRAMKPSLIPSVLWDQQEYYNLINWYLYNPLTDPFMSRHWVEPPILARVMLSLAASFSSFFVIFLVDLPNRKSV